MNNLNTIQEDALSGNVKSSYPGWQVNTTAKILAGTDDNDGKPGFWKGFLDSAKKLLTTGTLNMPKAKSYPVPPPYNDATQNQPAGRQVEKMAHISRFHKGNEWGTGAPNDVFYDGHEDPTFLTFKVEFGEWGASITDNISIASVQRTSINNNTWLMDYDQMPMGLLDLNYNEGGKFNDQETYNAFNYLMNRNEDRRAQYVRDFVDGLYAAQRAFPYMFQRINGVDKLTTVDTHQGQRLKDCVLKLSCINDTLDWKLRTLMELYRKAAWDDIYQRWSLPDIMRFFKMIIYVFDARTIAMPGGQFSPDNEMLPIMAFECGPCEFVISDSPDQSELTVDYRNLKMTEPTIDIRVHNVRTFYCNRMFKRVKYINDMYTAAMHDNSLVYTDDQGNITGAVSQDDGDIMQQDGRTIAWQYVWLQRMFMQPDEWALGAHWNPANETTAQSHYFADQRDEETMNTAAATAQIDQMPDNTWHYATVSDRGYIIKNFSDLWGAVKDIVTSRTQLIRDSRQSNRYYFVNDLFFIDQWSELARQQLLDIDVRGARADVIRKIKQMLRHLNEYAILDTESGYELQDVSINGAENPGGEPEPYIEQTDAPVPELDPGIKGEPYKYELQDVSITGAENPDSNPEPAIDIVPYRYDMTDASITGAENPERTPDPYIIRNIPEFTLKDASITGAPNPDRDPDVSITGGDSPEWELTLDISGGVSGELPMNGIPYTPAPKPTPDVFIIQNLDKYADTLTELDMNLSKPDIDLTTLELNLSRIVGDMTALYLNLGRDKMDLTPLYLNLMKHRAPLQELILNLKKYEADLTELDLNLSKPEQQLTAIQADVHKDIQQLTALILNLSRAVADMSGLVDDTHLPEMELTPMPQDTSAMATALTPLIQNLRRLKQQFSDPDTTAHLPWTQMTTVDVEEHLPQMEMNSLDLNLRKTRPALTSADGNTHLPENALTPEVTDEYRYVHPLTPTDTETNLPDGVMRPIDQETMLPAQRLSELQPDDSSFSMKPVEIDTETELPAHPMQAQDVSTALPEQHMSELRDDSSLPEQLMTVQETDTELPEQHLTELTPDDDVPVMILAGLDRDVSLPGLTMNGIEEQPYEPVAPTVHIDQETEQPAMTMDGLLPSDSSFSMKPVYIDNNTETPEMKMPDIDDADDRPEMLMTDVEQDDGRPAAGPMEDIVMNTVHDYTIRDSEVKEDESEKTERQEGMRSKMKDVRIVDNTAYAKDLLADRIRMLQGLDTDTLDEASFEQLNKLVGILQDTVSQVNRNIKMQQLEVRQEKTGRTMKMQHIIADKEESHFGNGHMKEMLAVSQDAMDRADAAYARAHEKKINK